MMFGKRSTALAILALVAITSSSGCTATIVRPVRLPLDPPPTLPAISADALTCLSPEAYQALVERDALQAADRKVLRATVEENNRRAEDEKAGD